MSGKTGEKCQATGPYISNNHDAVVLFFKSGDTFPACPSSDSRSGHYAVWSMVKEG